jgi:hypothetical protein
MPWSGRSQTAARPPHSAIDLVPTRGNTLIKIDQSIVKRVFFSGKTPFLVIGMQSAKTGLLDDKYPTAGSSNLTYY